VKCIYCIVGTWEQREYLLFPYCHSESNENLIAFTLFPCLRYGYELWSPLKQARTSKKIYTWSQSEPSRSSNKAFFFICCNEKYPTPTGRRLPHTTLIYNVIKTKQIVLTRWTTRRLSQLSGQTKYLNILWCIVYCLPASGVRPPTILLLQIPIGQCHHYFTRSRNNNHHVL